MIPIMEEQVIIECKLSRIYKEFEQVDPKSVTREIKPFLFFIST